METARLMMAWKSLGDNTNLSDGSKAVHGFAALADFDKNNDGKIDAKDEIFNSLKVWRDFSGDGVSDSSELFSLSELGIKALNLNYTDVNKILNGDNILTQIGSYEKTDGSIHVMGDVNFSFDSLYGSFSEKIEVAEHIKDYLNLGGSGRLRDLQEAMMLNPAIEQIAKDIQDAENGDQLATLIPQLMEQWAKTDVNYQDFSGLIVPSSVMLNAQGQVIGNNMEYADVNPELRAELEARFYKVGIIDSFMGTITESLSFTNEQSILTLIE